METELEQKLIEDRASVALSQLATRHNYKYSVRLTDEGYEIWLVAPEHRVEGRAIIRLASSGLFIKYIDYSLENGVLKIGVKAKSL
ncbi:MAG: hypothetical protein QW304_07565 [Thermoproteota archaeon]